MQTFFFLQAKNYCFTHFFHVGKWLLVRHVFWYETRELNPTILKLKIVRVLSPTYLRWSHPFLWDLLIWFPNRNCPFPLRIIKHVLIIEILVGKRRKCWLPVTTNGTVQSEWKTPLVFYAAFKTVSVISMQQITLSFVGFTSTKLGPLSVLHKGTSSLARIQDPWNTSQTLPLSHDRLVARVSVLWAGGRGFDPRPWQTKVFKTGSSGFPPWRLGLWE